MIVVVAPPIPRGRRVVARCEILDAPGFGDPIRPGSIGVLIDSTRIDRMIVVDFGGEIVLCEADEIAEAMP